MITDKRVKIYAQALMDSNSDYKAVLDELLFVEQAIESSSELKNLIVLPTVSAEQKIEILGTIFQDKISLTLWNFIKILAGKNYLYNFGEIIKAYKTEIESKDNIKEVRIVSAIDLNSEQKTKIINAIKNKTGYNINAFWELDKSIIGGLIVKYDDNVIDTSVKTKLNKIKGTK